MGKHRKEKITNSRFQDITLKGEKSVANATEFIAGFPPYVRGYQAMGHLQEPVEYEAISFQNIDNFGSNNFENQSVIIHSMSDLELIFPYLKNIKRLFIPFEEEKKISELFLNNFSDEILEKLYFIIFFDVDVFKNMEKVRNARIFWSDIMQKNRISHQIPIACYVNNISEQLYALSVQTDLVLYDPKNSEINDLTNELLLHNSGILKTIDPFWK